METYNARNLSPEQVARSFVLPDSFDDLCGNNHVVLMGPRGSGKTTMLKMLTVPALQAWTDTRAAAVRETLPFRAIYVPTDIHWHHQLSDTLARLEHNPPLQQLISTAAVTTNVLSAVTSTLGDLLKLASEQDIQREATLCEALIREWRLPQGVPLLTSVQQALRSRISEVYLWAGRLSSLPTAPVDLPEYFFLDYFAAAAAACGWYDNLCPSTKRLKWAFCFDELELAPLWLQQRLFSELRSTNQDFLLKLSTSPIPDLVGLTEARPRHDFTVVRLWPHSANDTYGFADRIVSAVLQRRLGSGIDAEALFGPSLLSSHAEDAGYERGSETWSALKDLAESDPGFRSVLRKVGIPAEDPYTDDISLRDRVLRKAKPIALLRLAFTKSGSTGPVRRSRKTASIYFGKDAIYDITDGNPRWLMALLEDLLGAVKFSDDGRPLRLPENEQATILTAASRQFEALLKVLPNAVRPVGSKLITLHGLLERIGAYFFHSIALQSFSLDPAGSFGVDAATPSNLRELLRTAAYHGAIVPVDAPDQTFGAELVGRRFRLSYMLAPSFRLPLRLYKAVPLSRCLSAPDSEQPGLPLGSADDFD